MFRGCVAGSYTTSTYDLIVGNFYKVKIISSGDTVTFFLFDSAGVEVFSDSLPRTISDTYTEFGFYSSYVNAYDCWTIGYIDNLVIFTPYTTGMRTGTTIELGTIGNASADNSIIAWDATENDQTITIETAISTDNGSTWSDWATATNGGSIPGITTGMDLSSAQLKCRQTLSTTDTSVTPQLHSLTLTVREQSLISGIYTVGGEFVNRTVRAHRRSDGAMLAESTVSPTDGTYSFDVGSDEECYLVFIDTTAGTYQYVLAASLQTPYEVNGCSGDDEVQSAMIIDRVYGSGYDGT